MSKRKSSPSPAAPKAVTDLPAPQASAVPAAAEASVTEEAPVSSTPVDADGDGHDDRNGQFVDGNQEAAADVEGDLRAAVAALLAASSAYAEVRETPQFLLVEGYRLQFAGHDLMTLTVN